MRYEVLNTPVDVLDMDETIERARAAMRDRQLCVHVALNAAKLIKMREDTELRADVVGADIIGIDGLPISWALRLLGGPEAPRVSGCDLMFELLAVCARENFRPYLLGARQDVLEKAAAVARARWPGLQFAGLRNGYFSADEEAGVVASIRDSGADCLFIAMPTPRKERFLARHAAALGVPFIMGVGGSVDVLAGHVARAPEWMQRSGLEWLFRLLQEPRKMARRYAVTNVRFIATLVGALMARESVRTIPEVHRGDVLRS